MSEIAISLLQLMKPNRHYEKHATEARKPRYIKKCIHRFKCRVLYQKDMLKLDLIQTSDYSSKQVLISGVPGTICRGAR